MKIDGRNALITGASAGNLFLSFRAESRNLLLLVAE